MSDYLPDWLADMLAPIEPQGVPSINKYAGKRLQDLENDPQARMDALDSIEQPSPESPEDQERQRQIRDRLDRREKLLNESR